MHPRAIAIVLACIAASTSILAMPNVRGLCGALLACLMVAIAAADARSYIIPDALAFPALVLGLIDAATLEPDMGGYASGMALHPAALATAAAALRGVSLALLFLAIRVTYRHLRGRHGMGLGDVKLAGVAESRWVADDPADDRDCGGHGARCPSCVSGYGKVRSIRGTTDFTPQLASSAAVRPLPRARNLARLADRYDELAAARL